MKSSNFLPIFTLFILLSRRFVMWAKCLCLLRFLDLSLFILKKSKAVLCNQSYPCNQRQWNYSRLETEEASSQARDRQGMNIVFHQPYQVNMVQTAQGRLSEKHDLLQLTKRGGLVYNQTLKPEAKSSAVSDASNEEWRRIDPEK